MLVGKNILTAHCKNLKESCSPLVAPCIVPSTFKTAIFVHVVKLLLLHLQKGGLPPCFLEPCIFDAVVEYDDVLNISDEDPTKEECAFLDKVRANCLGHTDLIIENGYSGEITIDHIEEISIVQNMDCTGQLD